MPSLDVVNPSQVSDSCPVIRFFPRNKVCVQTKIIITRTEHYKRTNERDDSALDFLAHFDSRWTLYVEWFWGLVDRFNLSCMLRGPKLGTYSDWGLSSVLVINKHLSHHAAYLWMCVLFSSFLFVYLRMRIFSNPMSIAGVPFNLFGILRTTLILRTTCMRSCCTWRARCVAALQMIKNQKPLQYCLGTRCFLICLRQACDMNACCIWGPRESPGRRRTLTGMVPYPSGCCLVLLLRVCNVKSLRTFPNLRPRVATSCLKVQCPYPVCYDFDRPSTRQRVFDVCCS